jgi:type II secretory pathway pseudopilin PulG
MSILANAKNKATSGSVKAAFTNENGAIDLASIMVGIIVIGLIGGVIAATVFAVIPWAQDNAAKQQLDSIVSAENAYLGLSTDSTNGVFATDGRGSFADRTGLSGANLYASTAPGRIAITGSANSAHYAAAVQSASGKIFYITDTKTSPLEAGKTGNATNATFTNNQIVGGTKINGVTFGDATSTPAVDVTWTGNLK